MHTPFASLEQKIEQIVALCAALRAENHRLRDRVGTLEGEKQGLTERMTTARTRLESLMDKFPTE